MQLMYISYVLFFSPKSRMPHFNKREMVPFPEYDDDEDPHSYLSIFNES
jgi:hypothetical protein